MEWDERRDGAQAQGAGRLKAQGSGLRAQGSGKIFEYAIEGFA
jgi:hypothetical protein